MSQPMLQPASQQALADLTGQTVGRFAIRARLGTGAMGEVYRADDTQLKRSVALKRMAPGLRSDESYRKRFLREAQCASGLTNQHIAAVYDVLEDNGEIFLVMEYVEGTTLRQRLSQPLSIEAFLEIAAQCAAALEAAHERGIVHRDVKPENVMLTPGGQVKMLDFGVAKQLPRADEASTLESTGSASSSFSGTLAYMAPEVLLERESDPRADIFSLGVVFYEALSGRHPFLSGSFVTTADRVLHEIPAPLAKWNPRVPAELERILSKMLAKDPSERYATSADLLVDLRGLHRGLAHTVLRPAWVPMRLARMPLRKLKRWVRAAAVGVLLVVGLGALPQVRQRLPWFRPAIAGPKSLVVLPFQAIGGAPENQAYSDGITDTLTAKLTQLTATHQLQVAPSRDVRSKRIANGKVARSDLGASLVIEGTLYRSGNTVRVNYALVDTGSLRQLRAETITADASDPFAVQDRVAAGIVRMLELELKPQERQALRAYGTQVAGAYEYYLQGRGYLQNYDKPENIENAISVFQRALGMDPNYALAHAGLGEAYWKKYENHREAQWVPMAREACERALRLDVKLAPAHICLGTIANGTGNPEKAVAQFRRAIEAEPTSDDGYRGLALAYEHLGKLEEAERTYRQAIELRPHYWAGYTWLGGFCFRQARYAEAAEVYKQVIALAPDSWLGYSNLGAMYILQGRYADGIPAFERSLAIRPNVNAYSNLATAYFFTQRFEDAARSYEGALKLDERNEIVCGNLGDAYYWAPGRRARAASVYQKASALAQENLQVNPRDTAVLGRLAHYNAMLGQRKPALDALEKALALAPGNPSLMFKAALVHNQLGETDQTIRWLEKALLAGYSPSEVRNTPNFERLQSNPGFQALFRRKQS